MKEPFYSLIMALIIAAGLIMYCLLGSTAIIIIGKLFTCSWTPIVLIIVAIFLVISRSRYNRTPK